MVALSNGLQDELMNRDDMESGKKKCTLLQNAERAGKDEIAALRWFRQQPNRDWERGRMFLEEPGWRSWKGSLARDLEAGDMPHKHQAARAYFSGNLPSCSGYRRQWENSMAKRRFNWYAPNQRKRILAKVGMQICAELRCKPDS